MREKRFTEDVRGERERERESGESGEKRMHKHNQTKREEMCFTLGGGRLGMYPTKSILVTLLRRLGLMDRRGWRFILVISMS